MYGFKAFVFNGKKTASKALDTLEDHTPLYAWIDDTAVVSKGDPLLRNIEHDPRYTAFLKKIQLPVD